MMADRQRARLRQLALLLAYLRLFGYLRWSEAVVRQIVESETAALLARFGLAVAFDNTNSANFSAVTTAGVTLTVGSGSNRAVMVGLTFNNNGNTSIAVSGGGATGWALVTGTDSTNSRTARTLIWAAVNPSSGSQTFTATWGGGNAGGVIGAITVTGVNQTTPMINGTFGTGTGATASVAITTANGDLTGSVAGNAGGNLSAPNQTQAWLDNTITNAKAGGEYHASTTTSDSHTWAVASTRSWVISGARFQAAGGSAFTQTVSGTLSFTGPTNLKNAVTKGLASATLSFTGAQARAISKGITASVSFAGTVPRAIAKGLAAASLSFTGATTKATAKSAMTATLSFAGAQSRAIGKGLTATLSFVGALPRAIASGFSAALSFSGAVARGIGRPLSASLTFAGTQSRKIGTGLMAALSFSGALPKAISTTLTPAALSFSGAMTKGMRRAFSATLGFAGSLATSSAHQFTQLLTASLSFAGAQRVSVGKGLSGALSFVGVRTVSISTTMASTLSFVGQMPRSIGTAIAGSLGFTGVISRGFFKTLTGTLSFQGIFTTISGQIIAGTVIVRDFLLSLIKPAKCIAFDCAIAVATVSDGMVAVVVGKDASG